MGDDPVLELTDDNFDEKIQVSAGPVLVDFWASWCGPCKQIAPSIAELAEEMAGTARMARVNVDENSRLTNRFGIRSIPTLVVFKGGRVVDQMIGAAPKERIRELIEKHVS